MTIFQNFAKELGVAARHVRRMYYFKFRMAHVQEQLARRKGVCGKHGCCDLSWFARRAHASCMDPTDRTKCKFWGKQPFNCKVYPFDEKDKIPETRPYCAFHWDDGK